jgi:hypothetical protein
MPVVAACADFQPRRPHRNTSRGNRNFVPRNVQRDLVPLLPVKAPLQTWSCESPLDVHKAGSDFFAGIAPSLPVKALSDSPRTGLSFGTCC